MCWILWKFNEYLCFLIFLESSCTETYYSWNYAISYLVLMKLDFIVFYNSIAVNIAFVIKVVQKHVEALDTFEWLHAKLKIWRIYY